MEIFYEFMMHTLLFKSSEATLLGFYCLELHSNWIRLNSVIYLNGYD